MTDDNQNDNDDERWRDKLTPKQFEVTRRKGTERAYTGKYNEHFDEGVYLCVCCEKPLFSSEHKYQSHCGWPAFNQPTAPEQVAEEDDLGGFRPRKEILCSSCGAHLGHVFEDGPQPTGLRYCVNSASLDFKRTPKKKP